MKGARYSFRALSVAGAVSNEHFSVDGTLLETLAWRKSFRPKGQLRCFAHTRPRAVSRLRSR